MDLNMLRVQAQEEARHFLEHDREYRMGYLEAELPHPMTRRLSQTCADSAEAGVHLLLSVDADMAGRAAAALAGGDYARFADAIRATLLRGGRVVFSGCGSSGRLAMRLEQSWRGALEKLSGQYPQAAAALEQKRESVGVIMTGGDYAVIRAVESFEDSTALGRAQAKQWKLGPRDLLVGVTATGETTSILGTAVQALEDGAAVYMLICADPAPLVEKMERARAVYSHPRCSVLTLPCGPMALTGSTRMQSSTFEQLAGAVALESALHDILNGCGAGPAFPGYGWYGQQFAALTGRLLSERAVRVLAEAILREQAIYERGGLITLYADDFLLDVLTDTTERAPTFMTPPFRSSDMADGEPSWAFVKNPDCDTPEAWRRCFLRPLRCIEWPRERYAALGFSPRQIERIPDIGAKALQRFLIGREPMPERESAPASHAMWIGSGPAPACFLPLAGRYASSSELTLEAVGAAPPGTFMDMFEHLCLKLMLNTVSTGVMARMGRIHGNWMTCLAMSNRKLIDRSARIVSDLCGIPYERAMEEIFFSRLLIEARHLNRSPVQETLLRLGIK